MKSFVRTTNREGRGFAFLLEKSLRISMEKLKGGIFDGLQIKELIKIPIFDEALSEAKLSVVTNILGNHRSAKFEKKIQELLRSFRQLGS